MKFSKVRDVKSPVRAGKHDAGIDFFVPNDWNYSTVDPREDILIPSGIRVSVPKGYMLTAFNKSGVAVNKKLHIGACVIDEEYQGEVHIHLFNPSDMPQEVRPGDKIAQFVLVPVFYDEVEEVENEALFKEMTARGEGGFGSTGTN